MISIKNSYIFTNKRLLFHTINSHSDNSLVTSYVRTENLLTLCNRHPANIPALITEIEWKLAQDKYLVKTIRDKLWEHRLEKQTYLETFKRLKSLIKEGAESHNKLLEHRYSVKKSLANQGFEDQRKLLALQNGTQMPVRTLKTESVNRAVRTLEISNQDASLVRHVKLFV